jgi:tRNA(Ile)-lysidine synthase
LWANTDLMLQQFLDHIYREKLFHKGQRLLLAVSGGLDSVVMTDLVARAGFSFAIAHCHFGLRDAESDRDAAFVTTLAQQYGVPVFTRRFETREYAAENSCSIQVAARRLRYAWFNKLTDPEEDAMAFDAVLTAHHADDNAETLLMHFFKGSGIAGLRGIPAKQGKIVRPILCFTREEIRTYAAEKGLTWVEDSSNADDHYTRNFFRHQVIPLVATRYPAALENLRNNLVRFRDIEALYRQQIQRELKSLLVPHGEEVRLPVLKLKKMTAPRTLLYEIAHPYGFTAAQTDALLALLDAAKGKYLQSASHRIINHGKWLIIAPLKTDGETLQVIDEPGRVVVSPGLTLTIAYLAEAPASPISSDPQTAVLDAGKIHFPLILRNWKAGDYFYPLGMRKKKKIGRFLSDLKRSVPQKENTRVLEMNGKIIWVVGERIDDRFKITPATTQCLVLACTKNADG